METLKQEWKRRAGSGGFRRLHVRVLQSVEGYVVEAGVEVNIGRAGAVSRLERAKWMISSFREADEYDFDCVGGPSELGRRVLPSNQMARNPYGAGLAVGCPAVAGR